MINKEDAILFIDTNILLRGFNILVLKSKKIFITPKIIKEIKQNNRNINVLNQLEAAINGGNLTVQKPEEKYIRKIIDESKKTGDYKALSEADIELLALSLEVKESQNENILIITDDYSMQNICKALNLNYKNYLQKGIKKKISWEIYCPICKKIFEPTYLNEMCDNCDIKLKRRPKKEK
ncbi:MAG: NOB1 family endonuclease [Promethearchaeota archaeon]